MMMLARQYRPEVARRAVLDLGSSSFHLLVADVTAGDPPVPIADVKCSVKLGEEALDTGVIGEDAWRRGLAAVDELVRRARELSAPLTIVGTSVLRDTRNGAAFAAAVTARTGCAVDILSGDDEAKLAWYGARTTRATGGTMTVIDLGGGSLGSRSATTTASC
jgi:exopolyphosphatase/guanosine-5'-triphosphate,3'-diphosphate pyrophosphatase